MLLFVISWNSVKPVLGFRVVKSATQKLRIIYWELPRCNLFFLEFGEGGGRFGGNSQFSFFQNNFCFAVSGEVGDLDWVFFCWERGAAKGMKGKSGSRKWKLGVSCWSNLLRENKIQTWETRAWGCKFIFKNHNFTNFEDTGFILVYSPASQARTVGFAISLSWHNQFDVIECNM